MISTASFVLLLLFLHAEAGPVNQHPKLLVVSYDAFRYGRFLKKENNVARIRILD